MQDAPEADSQEAKMERTISPKSSGWIRKFSLPLTVISAAIVLSFMIHGSGLEFAVDFPLDVSSEIEGGIDDSIDWVIITFGGFFDTVSDAIKVMLGKLRDFLLWIPWPIMMILVFVIGWKVASLNVAIISLVGLLILAIVNLWEPTMVTVAIMIVS
ncbi:MAG: hypothetical protein VX426_05610, partial [Chloroflexota bacterium]|nr:hypothetical protein [Chloroflexota bacterium]